MTCPVQPRYFRPRVKILIVLILGVLLGAGVLWIYTDQQAKQKVQTATGQIKAASREAGTAIQQRQRELNLGTNDIKLELQKTGQIVRTKARKASEAIADATADARITTTIKGKLVRHESRSALNISVNTTAGVVTLSGAVGSEQEISDAMLLAMEVEGVTKVISTLQVKAPPPQGKP